MSPIISGKGSSVLAGSFLGTGALGPRHSILILKSKHGVFSSCLFEFLKPFDKTSFSVFVGSVVFHHWGDFFDERIALEFLNFEVTLDRSLSVSWEDFKFVNSRAVLEWVVFVYVLIVKPQRMTMSFVLTSLLKLVDLRDIHSISEVTKMRESAYQYLI